MTETIKMPTVEELTDLVTKVQAGAAVLYQTLQAIASLHDVTKMIDADDIEQDACEHCSEINGGIVIYPCPTIQMMLEDFVVEEVSPEDQSSTGQFEPGEPSGLPQSGEEETSTDPS